MELLWKFSPICGIKDDRRHSGMAFTASWYDGGAGSSWGSSFVAVDALSRWNGTEITDGIRGGDATSSIFVVDLLLFVQRLRTLENDDCCCRPKREGPPPIIILAPADLFVLFHFRMFRMESIMMLYCVAER